MTVQEMWDLFSAKENVKSDYQTWAFGDDPDKLAQLVLRGIKTATASVYEFYPLEDTALPREGAYSVILDSKEEAVCIIRTTKVYIVPFEEVSEEHAWKEGEGDRSLQYWRIVHEAFFTQELATVGQSFHPRMSVVCEEFVRVFP